MSPKKKKTHKPKVVQEHAASPQVAAGEADVSAANAQLGIAVEADTAEALDKNAQQAGVSRAPGKKNTKKNTNGKKKNA